MNFSLINILVCVNIRVQYSYIDRLDNEKRGETSVRDDVFFAKGLNTAYSMGGQMFQINNSCVIKAIEPSLSNDERAREMFHEFQIEKTNIAGFHLQYSYMVSGVRKKGSTDVGNIFRTRHRTQGDLGGIDGDIDNKDVIKAIKPGITKEDMEREFRAFRITEVTPIVNNVMTDEINSIGRSQVNSVTDTRSVSNDTFNKTTDEESFFSKHMGKILFASVVIISCLAYAYNSYENRKKAENKLLDVKDTG